jgi:hypothetical protein
MNKRVLPFVVLALLMVGAMVALRQGGNPGHSKGLALSRTQFLTVLAQDGVAEARWKNNTIVGHLRDGRTYQADAPDQDAAEAETFFGALGRSRAHWVLESGSTSGIRLATLFALPLLLSAALVAMLTVAAVVVIRSTLKTWLR